MTTQEPQLPFLATGSVHTLQAQTSDFFPHGAFSGLFSPLTFAASSFFIPLPPSLFLWAHGKYLQCQGLLLQIIQLPSSSLRRKGLVVSFLLQIYPATRWHQGANCGRALAWWGRCMWAAVTPALCRHKSCHVWGSSRASTLSWGAMCPFLQEVVASLELLEGDLWGCKEE